MNNIQHLKIQKEKLADELAEVIQKFWRDAGPFDIEIEVMRFVKSPADPDPEAIVNITLKL